MTVMDDRQLKWVLENNPVDSSVKLGEPSCTYLYYNISRVLFMKHLSVQELSTSHLLGVP